MNDTKIPHIPAFDLELQASADEFWRYSLMVYDRADVAAACLRLQDHHGADVNMLLLGCWLAECQAGALDIGQWRALLAAVGAWRQEAVEPLRRVRRYLGRHGDQSGVHHPSVVSAIAALAKAVGDCELSSERVEQSLLVAALPPSGPPAATAGNPGRRDMAGANMVAYFKAAGLALSGPGRAAVEAFLGAVFDTTR